MGGEDETGADGFNDALRRMRDNAQQDYDRGQLTAAERGHSLLRVLDDLDNDSLTVIRDLLQAIGSRGRSMAHYYAGVVAGKLDGRGVCSACEKDHATELLGD